MGSSHFYFFECNDCDMNFVDRDSFKRVLGDRSDLRDDLERKLAQRGVRGAALVFENGCPLCRDSGIEIARVEVLTTDENGQGPNGE